jgi:hypothetical protein
VNDVQAVLYTLIRSRHEDGTLEREWKLWKLGDHMAEWLVLATAPATDTKVNPVLSTARTPGLHNVYIDMLFIGLSDNTRLEQYVSLYKTHNHSNMNATTLESMFLYHAELAVERLQLRAPELRSLTHGAGRASAQANGQKGKLLGTHAASKKQQLELCRLALARATLYDHVRYFKRGATSLSRIYAAEAVTQQEFQQQAAKRKARAQITTCHVTEGGKRRKLPPPPEAYWHLLNPLQAAGTKVAKTNSTGYGNDALGRKIKAARAQKVALQPPPGTVVSLRALSRADAVPLLKKRGGPRKAAAAAVQRVGENLQSELESAAEAEQHAAAEAERREAEAAAAELQLAAQREETVRELKENRERVAAHKQAAEAVVAATVAAAAEAREQHSAEARVREITSIEQSIREFRDAFKAAHKRSPTPTDMQKAAYSRQRMLIERYNQLKHGVAPRGLVRKR